MVKRGANRTARQARSGKARLWLWLLAIVAVALAGAAWIYRAEIGGYSGAGVAYSARVACSCRFVAGRTLDDCRKDKIAGMEAVMLSDDVETRSVTARIPLVASDTASYREGYGCVLKTWED